MKLLTQLITSHCLGIFFFFHTVSFNTVIYLGRPMHTWVQLKKERDSRAIIFGKGHTRVPVVLIPTEPSSFTCLEMPCMEHLSTQHTALHYPSRHVPSDYGGLHPSLLSSQVFLFLELTSHAR